jgi:hypothetical protein
MTRIVPAIAIVSACSAFTADAHQLDEYLQASRIGIDDSRVTLEMSLTPGSRVADRVFAMLDANGDERLSPAEIEVYARRVLSDVSLSVDGGPCSLTLARAESPSRAEMRDGIGTLHINAVADSCLARGRHELRFINRHQPDMGVYLVNALKPPPGISIQSQERDVQQHGIRMEVDVSGTHRAAWQIMGALVIVGGLVVFRRTGRSG